MTTVLITGISGVGKWVLTDELARRGHRAVDIDTPAFSGWVGHRGPHRRHRARRVATAVLNHVHRE